MSKREEILALTRLLGNSQAVVGKREKSLYILPPVTEDVFTRCQVRELIKRSKGSAFLTNQALVQSVDQRRITSDQNSFWSRSYDRLRFMRLLVYTMPPTRHVHLFHFSDSSFLSFTLPVILLARFLGKQISLYYLDEKAESDLDSLHESFGFALKLCDHINVTSRHLQSLLSGYNLKSELVTMPARLAPQSVLLSANIQPRVFMAGPLEKYTNIIRALKAFKLVKMKYPRAEMKILGDGSSRIFLEQFTVNNNINGVEFTGHVSDETAYRLLGEADLYLNSSVLGSLPASMIEAMTIGLPIVASQVGDVSSLLRDRESAFLVSANDHVSIADRIIELIEDPEKVRRLTAAAHLVALKFQSGKALI